MDMPEKKDENFHSQTPLSTLHNNVENVVLDRFLNNLGHSLLTPLNGIIGACNTLGAFPNQNITAIKTILSSTVNLNLNIYNLLELSKILINRPSAEKAYFNLHHLLHNLIEEFHLIAPDKKCTINIKPKKNTLSDLFGSSNNLKLIVANFLYFLIHTHNVKDITIKYKTLNTNSNTNLWVQIINNTFVFDKKYLDSLNLLLKRDIFTILADLSTNEFGLALSFHLVKTLDGTIKISNTGQGSLIELSFLFPPSEKTNHKPEIKENKLAGIKILLVEDHEVNQFLATSILSKWTSEIEIASDGEQAIEKLKKSTFDLVLMDLQMPVMNGFDTSLVIRKKLGLNIPVIALTANISPGIKENCIKAGMNDIISKPFQPEELLEKIIKSLQNRDLTIIPTEKSNEIKQSPEKQYKMEGRYFNLSKLDNLLLGNKAELKKMLRLFVEIAPTLVNEIKEGAASKDIKRIKTAAHKLKPSIDFLDIAMLKETIRELEKLPEYNTITPAQMQNIKLVIAIITSCISELE